MTGGSIKGYIPENALLVCMSPAAKNKVEQFPFVNWVGLYEPVSKISPTLMGRWCFRPGSWHGTHVSGSVLGSGTKSGGAIRGMAHNARLVFQTVEQWADWKQSVTNQYGMTDGYYLLGIPDDLNDLFQQA